MLDNWNCPVCKSYNDILTSSCISCKVDKPIWLTTEYQLRVEIKRGIFFGRISALGNYTYDTFILERENMTEQERLFAQFYNQEKILVKDMDIEQLRSHRDDLSKIAFEAKARVGAADDELRERKSKAKNKEFTLTDTQIVQSDAINAPKLRQARMTKLDKMREDLSKYLDEDTVNEMMRKMEKKATANDVNTIKFTPLVKPQTPVEVRIEEAKEHGIITDVIAPKPNPFLNLKKAQ